MDATGGFALLPILMIAMTVIVFAIVFGVIAVVIVKGLRLRARNDASPVETTRVAVVSKRTSVHGGGGDSLASTSYHVTFELLEGERVELGVSGAEYGQLAEGDRGMLTRQGTRYKGFVRDITGSAL